MNISAAHLDIVKDHLSQLKKEDCKYGISIDELNFYAYGSPVYAKYYDNCNHGMRGKYPVLNVDIIDKASSTVIDEFEFLRTDNGYKLISVSFMKNAF